MSAYPCKAHDCPVAGVIFPEGMSGGICRYHFGAQPLSWPRITDVLKDWGCVVHEMRRCSRVLTSPDTMTNHKAQHRALGEAWVRLALQVRGSEWEAELCPLATEHYANWGRRLEAFLTARITEAVNPARAFA